jgi:putative flippase GtrA
MTADRRPTNQTGPSCAPAEPRSLAGHPHAPLLGQFAKFAIVGVSNTVLFFATYTLLVKGLGVYYLLASAIAFAVGATNGFLLNRRFTFPGHVGDALTPVRWTIVQAGGLGCNELLLFLLVTGLGLDELLGQAVAIGFVVVATFFANRAWTFRMPVAAAASGVHEPRAGQPAGHVEGSAGAHIEASAGAQVEPPAELA